jgi:quinol monooxygenase YgiN
MKVSQEKSKEFLQTILLIIKSMRKEKGCLNYHFYQDMEDENTFRLEGKWSKQEDVKNHFRSDTFSILLGSMNLLRESPDIKFYVGSCTGSGMEAINMVRGSCKKQASCWEGRK